MRQLLRRLVAAGAVAAGAAAVTVGAPAQAAQASTTTHCPTSTSIALLPAGSGYLFPNLFTSVSACGFTNGGAPYHFTIDTATSNAQTPTGPHTYVVHNLSTVCSTVTVNGDSLFASGCQPG
ncbi:hypothetical protein JK361_35735 [Streptomyces sp. 5-8]|uniref:Uncharacterized protein n=1 Tax=Streptomyces musisoli TaxID=2802280 RepID=A0ABS1PBV9_9ACTN|nr:hypothetical protein [Streptomyces musisoli]MBL1109863.1 hypothetical protein [Streptomyces musisoli]